MWMYVFLAETENRLTELHCDSASRPREIHKKKCACWLFEIWKGNRAERLFPLSPLFASAAAVTAAVRQETGSELVTAVEVRFVCSVSPLCDWYNSFDLWRNYDRSVVGFRNENSLLACQPSLGAWRLTRRALMGCFSSRFSSCLFGGCCIRCPPGPSKRDCRTHTDLRNWQRWPFGFRATCKSTATAGGRLSPL